jgi:hypothetical protein
MTILAAVLFALGAALAALMTFSTHRGGPEGPVGFHMITAPLALLQAAGLVCAQWAGVFTPSGLPGWSWWLLVPGYLVAMTLVPVLPWEARYRLLGHVAMAAVLGGGVLLVAGARETAGQVWLLRAGLAPLVAVALAGHGVLAGWWWHSQRQAIAVAAADAAWIESNQREQAAFQRAEWQKLPPDAPLWQQIQHSHSLDAEVRAQCRSRLAALPDLEPAMRALLGTGWAEHALPVLRDAYPPSTAALAPELQSFYLKQADHWAEQMRGTEPGSWYGNLAHYVDVAERVVREGGDLRQAVARWQQLLRGQRGLESLAARMAVLAKSR